MAAKSSTPSFILELPVKTDDSQARILQKRFEAARQIYNACLGESMRRLNLIRQSKTYQKARKMPKGKERSQLFRDLNLRFDFYEYSLRKYSTKLRASWIELHVDADTAGTIAIRAFKAVQKVQFGQAKKVRFKGKNQFDSLESKSNKQGIRFIDGQISWSSNRQKKSKLELNCIVDTNDPVVRHGIEQRVKYCRLVKRKLNTKIRFFVQLVLEGSTYLKPQFNSPDKEVGLDIGPSTIAHISDNHVQLEKFCHQLADKQNEIRILQRKLDRQRRANNPQNYTEKGEIRKGIKLVWNNSNQYFKTKNRLAEIQRKQAAHRKSLHGNLANRILSQGNQVKTEKLSYKSFQRNYGKSVGFRAPSMLVEMLRRKAERAGGAVTEISTFKTKLSQFCHICGEYTKKPLSQRVHKCCNLSIQRDIYSAFLALSVKNDALDVPAVNNRWQSLEANLRAASKHASEIGKAAKGKHLLSHENSVSSEQLAHKVKLIPDEARNV